MRSASTPACSVSWASMRSESCLASSVIFVDSAVASLSALACIASASVSFFAASALSANAVRTASCCLFIMVRTGGATNFTRMNAMAAKPIRFPMKMSI